MGKDGGEALVEERDGDLGHGFAPAPDKLLHAAKILAWLAIGLGGTAYHNLVDLLLAHVLPEKVEELVGGHRGQPIGNDAQGVGDGHPRAFASVVDGQDATHPLFT